MRARLAAAESLLPTSSPVTFFPVAAFACPLEREPQPISSRVPQEPPCGVASEAPGTQKSLELDVVVVGGSIRPANGAGPLARRPRSGG